MALVKRVTNFTPIVVMKMNDIDSVIEFGKGARMFEVAQQLQALNEWDHYQVEVGAILVTKDLLVDIVREWDRMRREAQRVNQFNEQLISEEKLYKANIQDLLTHFKQQIPMDRGNKQQNIQHYRSSKSRDPWKLPRWNLTLE